MYPATATALVGAGPDHGDGLPRDRVRADRGAGGRSGGRNARARASDSPSRSTNCAFRLNPDAKPAAGGLRRVVLLVLFALLAGAATALSPCVLPVLPVALSAGVTGGRRRPLGVVAGLAALLHLRHRRARLRDRRARPAGRPAAQPGDRRACSASALLLLVPPLAARVEAWISAGSSAGAGVAAAATGSARGSCVGASLGFVYAPAPARSWPA